ncbi:MAG: undecaprenyl/decaprenyl-phosphate alpha-N-acetylglucosaminyl 1-phosphate transferase [Clostridia bacterium]|nr:undecaprenyl/decaprenyl-phosphate alpha-N-acetylglucosaminyl 1-phosphate transferase [Clostridia bacterium]MCI8833324.1 undecaprenyl/decaprenyl-phosphate alpha-N-acetylglucosaminyl 1-phosphate transferase [Clostridia bacterium]
MWGNMAIAFILAFVTTFVTTPYTIKIAKKVGAVSEEKDSRRAHRKTMPKFGGPAVILGFLTSTIYLLIVMSIENSINLFGVLEYWKKLLGFLVGILTISAFCIIDDIKTIKPITKLIGQVLSAVIVVASGIRIEGITLPFLNFPQMHEISSILITILWIIIVTNAINLIDGLDGLSSGISVISAISLLVIFVLNGSSKISIVLITALAGALVGFLPFNFTPAKTFIGDTGSNFLGYSLSVISILGAAKTYTAAVIVLPLIVLGLPIFDTIWAIIRRLVKGKSLKAVFKADKGHLHHKLVAKGFSQKQAVLVLYGISAIFGMFAVILCDSGIWKALSFLLIVIVAIATGYNNFGVERTGNEQYECTQCKYIYNPKFGNEKAGVERGTKFDDLPEEWVCPVCGEGKDMFQIHE